MYLVVTAPVHVAWCGTFVTTPQASKTSARAEVRNDGGRVQATHVQTQLLDPAGYRRPLRALRGMRAPG